MALVQTANDWTNGIAKQTNEATIATVATYDFAVFGGRPEPRQTDARLELTDAAAIQGDSYKQPDQHWVSEGEVVPAFANVLGTFLVGLWPTDTTTGAGPYTHTFSGLGGATPWIARYSKQSFSGNLHETYEASQQSGLSFSVDETGGPLRVGPRYVGKRSTSGAAGTWTTTTSCVAADGYFQAGGAVLKYDVDSTTPVTATNIQKCTVDVAREVTPQPTADSVSVGLISLGKIIPSGTMTLLWTDWDAYRATYFGAVAGTAPSATKVKGSVELNFVHTVQAGWSFKLSLNAVVMNASPPQPNPAGGPLTQEISLDVQKPAAGDHVKPILINAVTASY